jgi:hypothetical protein
MKHNEYLIDGNIKKGDRIQFGPTFVETQVLNWTKE